MTAHDIEYAHYSYLVFGDVEVLDRDRRDYIDQSKNF